MYDDPCILRCADWDFLANATDNRGMYLAWSFDNVSSSAAAAFDAAAGRLVDATADYAAADPVGRFGTGEVPFGETYPKIYLLAQCTPDMTAADCRRCLGNITRRFTPTYFAGKHVGSLRSALQLPVRDVSFLLWSCAAATAEAARAAAGEHDDNATGERR
jgi:hypothetical protein